MVKEKKTGTREVSLAERMAHLEHEMGRTKQELEEYKGQALQAGIELLAILAQRACCEQVCGSGWMDSETMLSEFDTEGRDAIKVPVGKYPQYVNQKKGALCSSMQRLSSDPCQRNSQSRLQ